MLRVADRRADLHELLDRVPNLLVENHTVRDHDDRVEQLPVIPVTTSATSRVRYSRSKPISRSVRRMASVKRTRLLSSSAQMAICSRTPGKGTETDFTS